MPETAPSPEIAVIGAGYAGMACAQRLAEAGRTVKLFDKGRGPGGRSSTRRSEVGRFDHGAPFFAVSDPDFTAVVDLWRGHGVASPWEGRFIAVDGSGTPEQPSLPAVMVGMPGMNGILKWLGAGLDIAFGVRVERIVRDGDGYRLIAEDGADLGLFGQVVVAVPSVQAVPLLAQAGAETMVRTADAVEVQPCWTVMAAFTDAPPVAFDAAEVTSGPLSMALHQESKPGRDPAEPGMSTWVLHASEPWTREHLEDDKDDVVAPLLDAFMGIGGPIDEPVFATAHRWRYAKVTGPAGVSHLWDGDMGVGACGDWLPNHDPHHGIEAAWRSGSALADAILEA
jgi:hypothetical protein